MKQSKPQHTPGPWDYLGNHVYAKFVSPDKTPINPTICLLSNTTTSMKENAALIAAAPEMYEALQEALPFIKKASDNFGSDYRPIEVLNLIESVLKKAQGES